MEVDGQLHSLATLPMVLIGQEGDKPRNDLHTVARRKNLFLDLAKKETLVT
jgi:hypothetical protein